MEGPPTIAIIFGVVVFFERCSSPEANSSFVTKTILTTAKVRDGNMIPKPTSYLIIKSVEPVEQSSRIPYGLGVTGPQRRAQPLKEDTINSVWNWNYWCQLQPKHGNCSGYKMERYYYHALVDSCKTFTYSGCNGNRNNFETFDECEGNCKAASRYALKDTVRAIYCNLQPSAGMCLDLIERYYYDIETNQCKIFVYGGCGGNQNRFDTIERCEKRCKKE